MKTLLTILCIVIALTMLFFAAIALASANGDNDEYREDKK